nr:2-oxoisovalerate dehydrogenase subunit alpha 1, mitochondrial-like [Tanacetum cinerariifolium]
MVVGFSVDGVTIMDELVGGGECTQLPQAVGVAYSLKVDRKDACVVAYLGDDGSSSEGDFHAPLNFAAVMEYGCSSGVHMPQQWMGCQAYGIQSIRVDGNDALAMYNAV